MLYMEVSEQLYKMILNSPGIYKLKSERDLAKEFNVSRITIRKAIQMLVNKGLISQKERAANFIKKHAFQHDLEQLQSLKDEMMSLGLEYTVDILKITKIKPPALVQNSLQISPTDKVYSVIRLIRVLQKPYIYEETFLPINLFPEVTAEDMVVKYDFIKRSTGYDIASEQKKISAEIPSRKLLEILELKYPSAILKIIVTATLDNGQVCDYVHQYFHSDYIFNALAKK